MAKSKDGELTGEFGLWLTNHLKKKGDQNHAVYYDHGDQGQHKNVAEVIGFCGDAVKQGNQLAVIDIIVVNQENIATLLIEIEESPVSPKALLGDMFASLLSDGYAVKQDGGHLYFEASEGTKLIIAAVDTKSGSRQKNFGKKVMPKVRGLLSGSQVVKIKEIELVFGSDSQSMIYNLKERIQEIL